jgi:hypothetical protein
MPTSKPTSAPTSAPTSTPAGLASEPAASPGFAVASGFTVSSHGGGGWTIDLVGEAAMVRLAEDIAGISRPGDVIALLGDLGAGKSTFARAFIRRMANDPALEAPSPTFTLMQTYDTPRARLVHADLYRIGAEADLADIGLMEELDGAIGLIEWPERAGGLFDPARRLDVAIALVPDASDSHRQVRLEPGESWRERLGLTLGARRLIDLAGWGAARRDHMQGDASTRAYERLVRPDGETAVLMISPPRPDGPPVKHGKPYSAIARLAERVDAFVALDKGLRAQGLSAPQILASDLFNGLLLIEDLGQEPVTADGGPIPERYAAAVEALAALHAETLPTILPVSDGREHIIPDYDREALAIETELLIDWYAPYVAGVTPTLAARSAFQKAWGQVFDRVLDGPRTWVLRDYHSPNLIWLPQREGVARVGIIDFQDAVIGHPAYDVMSLAQDARIDVDPALELKLLSAYATRRLAADPGFDLTEFAASYAILGAQRATKILGIFARLDKRDGKPAYLKHLPRMRRYLARNLGHPALAPVRDWHQEHLPELLNLPDVSPAEGATGSD